jgi:hypothetical protein
MDAGVVVGFQSDRILCCCHCDEMLAISPLQKSVEFARAEDVVVCKAYAMHDFSTGFDESSKEFLRVCDTGECEHFLSSELGCGWTWLKASPYDWEAPVKSRCASSVIVADERDGTAALKRFGHRLA